MASKIGQVLVTEAKWPNPYTYRGILSSGTMRKHALAAFRDGEDTTGMALWHAPPGGGAQRIDRNDVDWSEMGHDPAVTAGIYREALELIAEGNTGESPRIADAALKAGAASSTGNSPKSYR